MCGRKSRTGIRGIAIGLILFLLAASPCFSASYWEALFGGTTAEAEPTGSQNPQEETLPGESSPEAPTESLQTYDEKALKDLQKQLEALQEKQQSLEQASTKLESSATEFLAQSQSLLDLGKITDAQYEEMLATANAFAGTNAEQADRIAELEKAAGTRPYVRAGLSIGFADLVPTYGVNAAIGVRIGNHAMLEAGADYTIGDFKGTPLYGFSMDNLSFSASIGWMF